MKSLGNKSTVLGIAVGERSLLAAEVTTGDRPVVQRVAELVYPPGVTPLDASFGETLAAFRRDKGFAARVAVIGLPAKWIVVKAKEVPSADDATLADMLRLGAEAEFSSELKELVYDFVATEDSATGKAVLLVATQKKYVDAAVAACDAAKLTAISITSSALVLSEATGKASGPNTVVLAVSSSAAELTAQRNGTASVIRHLNGPDQPAPFVSAVRRAVSTLPSMGGTRELVLWDQTGLDAKVLGEQLGFAVRAGDLPSLGVSVALPNVNGESRRYGSAVALAMSVLNEQSPSVDFLHSRLAAPKARRLPPWARWSIGAAVFLLALGLYGFLVLRSEKSALDNEKADLAAQQDQIVAAKAFVDKVAFAKGWHAGDPRYLMCLRDLTKALADDQQTYATSLVLRETQKAPVGNVSAAAAAKAAEPGTLQGQLNGKTPEQGGWDRLLDALRHIPSFVDVKLGGTSNGDKTREVSFSITFTYTGGTAKH